MQIIDNFLDDETFNNIASTLQNGFFPFYCSAVLDPEYSDTVVEDIHNFQMVHIFYTHSNQFNVPQSIELIMPILRELKFDVLLRAKINLNPRTEKIITHGYHRDLAAHNSDHIEEIANTAVFYLNDNNGYTVFADGTKVESKKNRIVIFPASMSHSGTTCTDKPYRMVLNLNYIPKREQNENRSSK